MQGMSVDPQLRQRLQEITDTYIRDQGNEQISCIEQLGHEYPHSISLVQEAISGKPETVNFTCFQYAFGLVDPPARVQEIAASQSPEFFGSSFAKWLANGALQETDLNLAQEGDLVLYFQDGEAKHAAKICGDSCISKWGLGHLWRHGLLEVPKDFGSQVRYFRSISSTDAAADFVDYAREKLGSACVDDILSVLSPSPDTGHESTEE